MIELPDTRVDEQKVIGTAIASPWTWEQAAPLDVDDFRSPVHRCIWEAIADLKAAGHDVHPLSVADTMRESGTFSRLEGGVEYLDACVAVQGMPWAVEQNIERIRLNGVRWRLVRALAEATGEAANGDNDPLTVVANLRAELGKLNTASGGPVSARIGIIDALDAIEARMRARNDGKTISGARTGVSALDNHTSGLQPGWLVVIAAETGGGKTALAMQTALHVALSGGASLACNLEMESRELFERSLSHRGDVNSNSIRTGTVNLDDWRRMEAAARVIATGNLYVEDKATTLAKICSTARRWRGQHASVPGLLVVDFLQLIRSERDRGTTRAQEVGQFAQELKALAKELRVPVILVSQLNRAGVKSGQQPSRLDLKESGDIENAADLILLPWNKTTDGADGEVSIIVDKFRNGQRTIVTAHWRGSRYEFTDNGPTEVRYAEAAE